MGLERLPPAVDHPDRSVEPDDSAGPVRLQLAVRHQLPDGLLQLPDGHGPDPHRLHLRPKVGRRWCDEGSGQVAFHSSSPL